MSITGFFIKNFRFTYLIIGAILVFGTYSLFTLPREAEPEVKIPFAVVNTIYPGASPSDVEELVTNKIEDKIKNLDNLRIYTSSSGQGFSSIFVEFNAEADLKQSYQKLRDEVAKTKSSLPQEAEDPIVTEIRFSDMPIISYSLTDNFYAEDLQKKLESIQDVSKVEIIGEKTREFQILVNQEKLVKFNLSLNQIIGAIQATNFNMPAGEIEINNFKYNIRVKNKINNIQELNNIIIATYNNSPVYLSDIAEIQDAFKAQKTQSKIGFYQEDSKQAVSLQVYKKTGGNILNIVDSAQEIVQNFSQEKNIKITKTTDNAWFIRETLNRLGMSGLQTMILIIILLFIVLGIRGALITGFSVPIAFFMSVIFLKLTGQTLNSMVLYSLIISLGLMVDNSIIIMEGINEYMTDYKKKPLQAALLSVWNFKWAITSGTLTTVSAFLPMLLVSGILGQYFAFIPKTISATLLSSLFVALIIIPTLSAKFIKPNHKKRKFNITKLKTKYANFMRKILISKKNRRLVLAIAWACFIIAILLPILGFMKIEMFSQIDFDTFLVTIKLAPGSSLEQTNKITNQAEQIIYNTPEIKSYLTTLGVLRDWHGNSNQGSHLATVSVNLKSEKKRKRKSYEIADDIRTKLKNLQNAEIRVEEAGAGPPTGAPIQIRIFGDDINSLISTADQVENNLKNISGVINIKQSIEDASGEFVFKINKQKASYYGVSVADIAFNLRTAIHGTKASSVSISGQDINIYIKYNKNINLDNILIFTPKGWISLNQITDKSIEPSFLSINHRDGQRIISVSANLEEKANLQKILKQIDLPSVPGVDIQIGGELEDIEKSYRETFLSMIVAVILIAFILVLQFNSFKQPLIIIFALPLAVIGVIFGLNILRMPFSFPVFLGIVSLAGIAVNDAIVLIDRINKNIKSGLNKLEAIIESGQARMQPIFLTSITTIAGVFPLVFADAIWRGFAIALIFGLIFSTGLTLIIIPIIYRALVKIK